MALITEVSGIQGGIKTTYSSYTVHTFKESSIFIILANLTVDYLLVAGGGSGSVVGGGGGAGGVVVATSQALTTGQFPVIVGSGGQRAMSPAFNTNYSGFTGTDTTFNGKTAKGGGGGGTEGGRHL